MAMSGIRTPQEDLSRSGTPVQQLRGAAAAGTHTPRPSRAMHEPAPSPGMTQPRRSYSKTYVSFAKTGP